MCPDQPATAARAVYVGTTRVDRSDENVEYGPDGTVGVGRVPTDATVIGMYEAGGRLYLEWVCDV